MFLDFMELRAAPLPLRLTFEAWAALVCKAPSLHSIGLASRATRRVCSPARIAAGPKSSPATASRCLAGYEFAIPARNRVSEKGLRRISRSQALATQ